MKSTFAPSARRRRAMRFAVVVGVAAVALTMSIPVAAAAEMAPRIGRTVSAPPPGLSITLGDAKTQTQSGATLTYVASVTNAGAEPVNGMLDVTIPSYAAYVGTAAGKKEGPDIKWPVTVGAGKSVSRKVTVKLGEIPKGEVRFTSIATLYSTDSGPRILVRTADPDGIRGVVDPAHSVGVKPAPQDQSTQLFVPIGIVLGSLVVVGLAFLVWVRKRRGARSEGAL
jgi:hypothetical protein